MEKRNLLTFALCLTALLFSTTSFAEDEEPATKPDNGFHVSAGCDIMSQYVWRGMNQEQALAVQPTLSLDYKGLSLGVWGSTSLCHLDPKEVDIYLSYEVSVVTFTLTDYFWNGEGAKYGDYKNNHYFELAADFYFGEKVPLSFSWATFLFCGADEKDEDDKRMFSSYFNLGYDFDVKGVTLTPAIGFNPWTSQFCDGFKVTDITLSAAKDIQITDKFALPLFAQFVVSPAFDKAYLIVGFTF